VTEIYREVFYRIILTTNVDDVLFFESSWICVRLHACAKFALLLGFHSVTSVRRASFQIYLQHTSLNFPVPNAFCIITNISGVLVRSIQICLLQHTSLNFPVPNVFYIITNISGVLVRSKSPFMSWTSKKTPCLSNWVISYFRIRSYCCVSCSATKYIEIMKFEGTCCQLVISILCACLMPWFWEGMWSERKS